MELLPAILLIATLLALGLVIPAIALRLTTRLLRIEHATMRTAFKITVVQLLAFLLLVPLLGVGLHAIGLGRLTIIATLPISFILFHLLLRHYHHTGLGKNTAAYVLVTVVALVLSFVVLLPIRVAIQNYTIAGHNMEPNLHPGQYVMVDTLAYRRLYAVHRGDIIIFRPPRAPRYSFVGRVIGLPGETVDLRDGVVYINDRPLSEHYLGVHDHSSVGPTELDTEQYYILGDNRINASDSRAWGPLPKERIVGRVWMSYWPPPYWGTIKRPTYSGTKP